VRALGDAGCVHSDAGPERVSLGMALIARASFLLSGVFPHGNHSLWVHCWTDDCAELKVESSFPEPLDLWQVAYDVGTQLGRAHPKGLSGAAAPESSKALLLESTRENEGRTRHAVSTSWLRPSLTASARSPTACTSTREPGKTWAGGPATPSVTCSTACALVTIPGARSLARSDRRDTTPGSSPRAPIP
jgi:hypothetical protein